MTPTPIRIALRAFTLRTKVEQTNTERPSSEPLPSTEKRRRSRRAEVAWPSHVLVFDTETTTDQTQCMLFGVYRVLKWAANGTLALVGEGLFHADDLDTRDRSAFLTLKEYVAREGISLISRREFIRDVFYRISVDGKGLVVGFNLPFDLARIAIDSAEARGRYHGGFSFALAEYFDRATKKYKERAYRPRVCVKSINNKAAFSGFQRPIRTKESRPETFQGNFLDLRTLAYALSGKGYSLASACDAFGVTNGKLETEEYGHVTPEFIAYARRDVLATQELLARLRTEFDQLGLPLLPTKAYSPASLAKAAMHGMGITPLYNKAAAVSPVELGHSMNAFYGGRAECRMRRVSVPVVSVDFRSMYPTVNCLMHLWRIVIAASIHFEDCTDQMRVLLANASTAAAFSPELWPQLTTFAELEPDEDIVPVRGQYTDAREGWNIGVNYFTSRHPITYAMPDIYASAILTGKTPRIRRAWRLVGEGVQPGLRSLVFGGTIAIDPRDGDFFRTLIEERVRIMESTEYPPEVRARLALLFKLIANSGGYGIFAELNREQLPDDDRVEISVFGHGDPYGQTTTTPEEMGSFCFPPIAAFISSAARLMLALLEKCVTDRGGTYAFCDTDSMAIIATQLGGLIECEGGTADSPDRIEAIRALTWADVNQIRERFNSLNPYDPAIIPSILNIEDENFANKAQRPIWAHVISAKRYALFTFDESGAPHPFKCSKHGLGQLMRPIPKHSEDKWPDVLWALILAEAHEIPPSTPNWLKYPAVARVSVTTPSYFRGFLKRFEGMPYAERIKPFGFLLSCTVSRFGHPDGADPKAFHLLAPYSTEPEQWGSQIWADSYSGDEFGVVTGTCYVPGIVSIRSLADIKAEFLAHGEIKSETPDGEPAGARSRGVLNRRHVSPAQIVLIGKESNRLDEVEAGLHGDLRAVLASYEGRKSRPSRAVLRSMPAAKIAVSWNVTVRTVRSWRRKGFSE